MPNRAPEQTGARRSRLAQPTEFAFVDPQVHRSRSMLRDALLGLIRKWGFDTISVQDITERAQLNRSTFYLHHRDKDDLLTHIMRDMIYAKCRSSSTPAGRK